MEVRLLGPVECVIGGSAIPLRRFQERSLLAVLAVDTGHTVPVDRLVELLWDGEPPARARSIVRTHVSRLRRHLTGSGAPVALRTHGQGYRLDAADDTVDVQRFRRLVATARRAASRPQEQVDAFRAGLALWRGPALADAATERIAQQICAGLEEARLAAWEDLAEIELALSRHRELVAELTDLAARNPLRERLIGLLMRALYRSGQQARALAVYRRTRMAMVDQLGIDPGSELRLLEQAILTHDSILDGHSGQSIVVSRSAPVWRGPRSRLTSIVGRDREVAEVDALLSAYRLVTMVGPGGVGKTTLAGHVAEQTWATGTRDVAVASLAAARDQDDVVLAIADLLDVSGPDVTDLPGGIERTLADGRPRLLVLDNCEHLAIGPLVRRLLSASADLVVMATSRQPIGLVEETVWRLEPLPVPATGTTDQAAMPAVPAVALFLRRALESRPGFTPTTAELDAIARICRRVDGLPLALELAASRLRTVDPAELADQLDHGLGHGLAAEDRLAATIDWSYRLLEPEERTLLARLSAFPDSFDPATASAVAGAAPLTPDRIPALLSTLVDRSLVQREGPRHRMLQVVREFAASRLDGDTGPADRLLGFWLDRATSITKAHLEDQFAAWGALGPEIDTLRAALSHGYASDVPTAVELTALTFDLWQVHHAFAEASRWIAAAERHRDAAPDRTRCLVRYHSAVLQANRDDYVGVGELLRPVLNDLRLHHPVLHLDARLFLSLCAVRLLDPAALAEAFRLRTEVAQATDPYLRVNGAVRVADALYAWGRYEQTVELCDWPPEDLTPSNALRLRSLRCRALVGLGRLDAAADDERELLAAFNWPGRLVHLATPGHTIALYALAAQRPTEAAVVITDMRRDLVARYGPAFSSVHRFDVMLAETDRRAGRTAQARTRLGAAFAASAASTDYRDLIEAVVVAALLAHDLGDRRAARDLAERWNALRLRTGLPAPAGFAVQVADVLGLDPAAPPAPEPGYTWNETALRDLIDRAHRWTAGDQARVRVAT